MLELGSDLDLPATDRAVSNASLTLLVYCADLQLG